MSRHDLAAVPMAAVWSSATALGICGGFRLYTLRRAQPLSMCRHTGAGHSCHRFRLHDRRASCPFSGAVRRSRLPGIVSLHSHLPHGGRDPPARIVGWFSAVQRRGPILPASVPGGRKGGCGKSPAHAGGRGCRNRTCDMRAKTSCLTAWRIPCVMLWRRLVKAVIPLYPSWKGTPDFPLPPYRVGAGWG